MLSNFKFYCLFLVCVLLSLVGHLAELYLIDKFWIEDEIAIEQFLIGYFIRSIWSISIGFIFYHFIFNHCQIMISSQLDNFKNYYSSAPADFVKNYTKNLDNYIHMVIVGTYQLIIDSALLLMFFFYFFINFDLTKIIDLLLIFAGFFSLIVISMPVVLNYYITRSVNNKQIAFYQFIENFRRQIDTLNIFVEEREYLKRQGLRVSKKYYQLLKYQFFIMENVRYFNEAILVLALLFYIQVTGFNGSLAILLAGFFRFYPILIRCYSNANRIVTGIPYALDFKGFQSRGKSSK